MKAMATLVSDRIRILVILCILIFARSALAKTPVILSTDIGNEIDDQWAIAYMMASPDLEVLGVMSAHSPSLPDPSGYRSYLLLKDEIENRLGLAVHPPILQGGDAALKDKQTAQSNEAVLFLVEQSKRFSRENRLTVLVIGAATDVASAILVDPSIVDRIRVVSMAFKDQASADEYNVLNDIPAWQVLLGSKVPLVIGPKDVCRKDLAMYYEQARTLLSKDGVVGAWLWSEWNDWYFRMVKPLRKDDFSKPRAIWDLITVAYVEGFATTETKPRPSFGDDFNVTSKSGRGTVEWITHVDSERLWSDFQARLNLHSRTHAIISDVPPVQAKP